MARVQHQLSTSLWGTELGFLIIFEALPSLSLSLSLSLFFSLSLCPALQLKSPLKKGTGGLAQIQGLFCVIYSTGQRSVLFHLITSLSTNGYYCSLRWRENTHVHRSFQTKCVPSEHCCSPHKTLHSFLFSCCVVCVCVYVCTYVVGVQNRSHTYLQSSRLGPEPGTWTGWDFHLDNVGVDRWTS